MAVTRTSTQLGCGRSIDDVWLGIGRAPDRHELGCPFCGAARSDLAGLAQATAGMRKADEHDPDLRAAPEVVDRVMAIARSEVRRGRRLPLHQPTAGSLSNLSVSEQAVTAVIRRVGDRGGLVQIRRCRLQVVPPDATARTARPSPTAVRVSLKVTVKAGTAILAVVEDLRLAIIAAVEREVGIDVQTIDIAVEDVFDA